MRFDTRQQGFFELEPFGTSRPAVRNLLILNTAIFFFFKVLGIEDFGVLHPGEVVFQLRLDQLLTYGFLHADFMHLFFNMFALWMFGSQLERFWGSRNLVVYYISCIAGAGVLHILLSLLIDGFAPSVVGASGAVYGLIAAYGLLFARSKVYLFAILPMKASTFALLFGAISLLSGLSGASDGVAHFAHLGGMLTGVGLIYWRPLMLRARQARHTKRMERVMHVRKEKELEKDEVEKRVDFLLDKIRKQGMDSLDAEEKRFLDEASAWLRSRKEM